MSFESPLYLFFLLLLIPLIVLYILRERKKKESLVFSKVGELKKMPSQFFVKARHILLFLRVAGISLLIVALARPRTGSTVKMVTSDGIDIVMVLDVSTSMKALDFKPKNRLAVAKKEIGKFVDKREADRVGLVLFAGRSFTKCPLTLDYAMLKRMVNEVDFGIMKEDGTAIGTAISTAAMRLTESKAQSKVMILLTDGDNNKGKISPELAAKEAAKLGIKIYTIGIGKKGLIDYPVTDNFFGRTRTTIRQIESDLNEEVLKKIAAFTGGEYFRAHDSKELETIYDMINNLEKTEIETRQWTDWEEKFYPFLIAGFILLMLDFILTYTRFRRIP